MNTSDKPTTVKRYVFIDNMQTPDYSRSVDFYTEFYTSEEIDSDVRIEGYVIAVDRYIFHKSLVLGSVEYEDALEVYKFGSLSEAMAHFESLGYEHY